MFLDLFNDKMFLNMLNIQEINYEYQHIYPRISYFFNIRGLNIYILLKILATAYVIRPVSSLKSQ